MQSKGGFASFTAGEARLPAASLALSISKADTAAERLTSPELIWSQEILSAALWNSLSEDAQH